MKTALAPTFSLSEQATTPTRPAAWLRVLHGCQPALAWAGWLHLGLLLACLVLWTLDGRTVTGLNVWIKPAKFSLSGLIYLWTLAWLLADVPAAGQRAARRIGRLVALSMVVEMACIVLQAARGTTSHFNIGSAFDGAVFQLMGIFIGINTVAIVWALGLVFRQRPFGSAAWVWGIRLGLLVFLVGSVVGGVMAGRLAHTVGAADGGAGLPILGWSTRHGDLRAAHFLGLHALQALPLAGWLLGRRVAGRAAQTLGVAAVALLYAGAVGWLFWHAMQGLPLW
ncbi:hypothetical protein [Hymenobacter jeollabukensis]|uniref:Uncharacterized protein n=1 Tax=Hymenobacter jeollabukensis TaxID=2025313 RepID=A0A5R8WJN6_9BACT|nr:hypothetical protein [Hymenobacter jeollabukensis]TLM89149.1 hypothetical protein FDY95_21505 [Hymenobacter jeollabukensis]